MKNLLKFEQFSNEEYKEKIIDLLLWLGGKLYFFDDYFVYQDGDEERIIIEVFLESPDSMEISIRSLKRCTHPGKIKKSILNSGWDFEMYKKLYEHCLRENKKINEIGCWCV